MHFGSAIESDLAGKVDLGTEWRARRWRKLLNLIDNLPRDSIYVEAMTEDQELAAQINEARKGAAEESGRAPARRMSEWSPTVELLSVVADRMGELVQVQAATRGARPRSVPSMPRPVTAAERLRGQRRIDKHVSLVQRVMPHKYGNQPST